MRVLIRFGKRDRIAAGIRAAAWSAIALSAPISPARAADISKGTVTHPGGNTSTTLTLATFVSTGADVIVIYEDIFPFVFPSITLSPTPPQLEQFSYSFFSFWTVTTYRGLTAGQSYSCIYSRNGPIADTDRYQIFENGCAAGPAAPIGSCVWDDAFAVGEQIIRFEPSLILGQSMQKSVHLRNTGTQALSTTVFSMCPEFTILNPIVSIAPGGSTTINVQYTPTIDDEVAGALRPTCMGSLLLGTGLGPRLVIGSASNVRRVRLDGAADKVIGSGAAYQDFAVDVPHGRVYQAQSNGAGGPSDGIYGSSVDGFFTQLIAVKYARCVDVDPSTNRLYWVSDGRIRRSNTDGSGAQDLPVPISGGVTDLAIDPQAQLLYWFQPDRTSQTLRRANLDGSNPVALASLPAVTDAHLALDAVSGRVYWSETAMARIRRIDVDGTNAQTLMTPGIVSPGALGVDAGAGRLYWSDAGTNSVHRVDLGGLNHQEIVTGLTGPTGLTFILPIAPQSERIYWTDHTNFSIESAYKDGSSRFTLLVSGLVNPLGLDIDPSGGKLYWVDQGTKKIQRANLDGTSLQGLVTTGNFLLEDLALDIPGGKMYWADSGSPNRIRRANLDGTSIETLLGSGIFGVRGIALDRAAGLMYWTESETGGDGVYRGSMNGGTRVPLVQGLGFPVGIALDPAGGKMYWIDSGTHKIQRANLNGTGVQDIVVSGTPAPLLDPRYIKLDLGARKVYWTDVAAHRVQRANLDGSGIETVILGPGLAGIEGVAVTTRAGFPVTSGVEDHTAAPPAVRLDIPHPNPFNPTTRIAFAHGGGRLVLEIYSVDGRLTRSLFQGDHAAGNDALTWDGRDDQGVFASSGVYFVKMRSAGLERSAKVVLLR